MNSASDKERILIVDDTPDNIDLLVGVLQPDYEIMAAINGERALKIARAPNKPDMILLDIMMPGLDGYEVCRQLKADPAPSEIPVIFITAKSEVADETQGFAPISPCTTSGVPWPARCGSGPGNCMKPGWRSSATWPGPRSSGTRIPGRISFA